MKILSDHRSCTTCDLCTQAEGVPCNVGIGSRLLSEPQVQNACHLWYVGRNPGYHEDVEGNPFVGRSGQLLCGAYIPGINATDRAQVYLTNGVRCYTVKDEPPKSRHWKNCLNYLRDELVERYTDKPTRVGLVLLGGDCTSHVYRNVFGVKGMNLTKGINENGATHKVVDTNIDVTLFSTYHPSAVLRDPNYINAVYDHNSLISDWLDEVMATPSEPTFVPTRSPNV